jgi:hypothetical protein
MLQNLNHGPDPERLFRIRIRLDKKFQILLYTNKEDIKNLQ